jgi:cupin 2 domain-containing protein
VSAVVRGRLRPSSVAPASGEWSEQVARLGEVMIEQIVSGALDEPVDYDQDHEEWVVVLQGGATLQAEGETLELGAGDWVLLPAHVPHRLLTTTPGTSWLALHAGDGAKAPLR